MGVVLGGARWVVLDGVLGVEGGIETRRWQSTEWEYEGTYTFGAFKQVGGQERRVKNQSEQIESARRHDAQTDPLSMR